MDKKILDSLRTLETASLDDLKKLKNVVKDSIFVDLPGPFGHAPDRVSWATVSFMDLGKRNLDSFYMLAVSAFLYRAMNEYDAPSDDARMTVKRFLDSLFSYDPLRHVEHGAPQPSDTDLRANMLLRGMNSTAALGPSLMKTALTNLCEQRRDKGGRELETLLRRIVANPDLYRLACGIAAADRTALDDIAGLRPPRLSALLDETLWPRDAEHASDPAFDRLRTLVQTDPLLQRVVRGLSILDPELANVLFEFRDSLKDVLNPIADMGLLEDGVPPRDTIRAFGSFVNINREPLNLVMKNLGLANYPPFRCLGVWDSTEPLGEDDARAKFKEFCAANKDSIVADCALVPFGRWVVLDDTRGNTRNVSLPPHSLAEMINSNIDKDNKLAEAMIKKKVERDALTSDGPEVAPETPLVNGEAVAEYQTDVSDTLRSASADLALTADDREAIRRAGGNKHLLACMKLLADLEKERETLEPASVRAHEVDRDIEELKLTLKNPDADLIIPVVKIDVENRTVTKEHV